MTPLVRKIVVTVGVIAIGLLVLAGVKGYLLPTSVSAAPIPENAIVVEPEEAKIFRQLGAEVEQTQKDLAYARTRDEAARLRIRNYYLEYCKKRGIDADAKQFDEAAAAKPTEPATLYLRDKDPAVAPAVPSAAPPATKPPVSSAAPPAGN
jgi:hypothetical protein